MTIEPQYQHHIDLKKKQGLTPLGVEKSAAWHTDPRRLLFVLSRYKFVAKMLSGMDRVLEVGCGDGWPLRMVLQEVKNVHGIDIDPVFIDDIKERLDPQWPFTFAVHDILKSPVKPPFDAAFSLDVLEHIRKEDEQRFLKNIVDSLTDKGVAIFGTPSLASQQHASPLSKAGHVNCKDAADLKRLLTGYFDHVFIFSMNDEVVHTGYYPMAQYLLALCTGIRQR
ncbi:MAG TPA: class I SAM-dependent methyltransferase [Candidatus Omnitrophota bacterium]|nr:class I SAM-dependent methyltransferase [Candidatus Omnitrophota bacterium]HRY85182.1 class I SAM-dependent methyltransferase [Candidatus Omnitrophota bacterium]